MQQASPLRASAEIRGLGKLIAGVVAGQGGLQLAHARGSPPSFLKDSQSGYEGYTDAAGGVKIKASTASLANSCPLPCSLSLSLSIYIYMFNIL